MDDLPITLEEEEPPPPGPSPLVALWTLVTTAAVFGAAAGVIVYHLSN